MIWVHELRIGLSLAEKAVAMVLAEHANEDGSEARPAVDTIAAEAEISRRAVQLALRVLEDRGLIAVQTPATSKKPAVYRVLVDLTITAKIRGAKSARGAIHDTGGAQFTTSRGEATSPKPVLEPIQEEPVQSTFASLTSAPEDEKQPKEIDRAAWCVKQWNECLGETNGAVLLLTDRRRTAVLARYRDLGSTPERWLKYLALIQESEFLTGRAKPREGKRPFKATFDFATNATDFAKITEGNYGDALDAAAPEDDNAAALRIWETKKKAPPYERDLFLDWMKTGAPIAYRTIMERERTP